MVEGDLVAQAACLEVAERRVIELCGRYGVDIVTEAMREVHARSEALARTALASLPHGVYEAEDHLDDDGVGGDAIPIRVRVTLAPDRVVVDLSGSSAQVGGPVNCTWSGLVSGIRTVFKAITDPTEPASDAWFHPLEIVCPTGSVFNAVRPAPVAAYFEATEAATDLVWKALATALPDRLTAGSFVSVCATSIALEHADTGEATLLVEPQPGGWGASASKDGEHALVSVGDGETYTIPVEVAEQRYGVLVERVAFDVVDGAGAGRRRGGRGLVREYRILSDEAVLTVAFGRHRFPPWGVAGGRDGSVNAVEVVPVDGGPVRRFGKAASHRLRRGDRVRLITGTGGGHGDPKTRERDLVREDLANGLISERDAIETYGLDDRAPND
jgi:N-methylhydantoinase B